MFAVKHDGDPWSVSEPGEPGRFNGIALIPNGGAWILATVGTPVEGGTAPMSVRLLSTADAEWSSPRSLEAEADATGLFRVLTRNEGREVVVLVKALRAGAEVLRAVSLSYPELNVLRTTDVMLPRDPGGFVAALDACDGVQVVVEYGANGVGKRGVALGRWDDGWSEFESLQIGIEEQSPAIAMVDAQEGVLTILSRAANNPRVFNTWLLRFERARNPSMENAPR